MGGQLLSETGILINLQGPVMGMGIEEMVGGVLEIAFKALLSGMAVGKQQIAGLPPHHFQRCCLVFLFHTVLILHFGTGSRLLFCIFRRTIGPLFRIPFGPISRRVSAPKDSARDVLGRLTELFRQGVMSRGVLKRSFRLSAPHSETVVMKIRAGDARLSALG